MMKTDHSIVRVEMVECQALQKVLAIDGQTAYIGDVQRTELCIKPMAELAIVNKNDSGNQIYTATLKMSTPGTVPCGKRLAFIAHTMGGKMLLIGTGERPYAAIQAEEIYPSKATDSQLTAVTVTHTDTHPPLTVKPL